MRKKFVLIGGDMNLKKQFSFALVAALVFATARAANAAQSSCEFIYDESMQNDVVVPLLKKEYGTAAAYFNYDSPIIEHRGNYTDLIFGAFKSVSNRTALYENVFVVTVDSCTRKVAETQVESPG
jgi:hypothetical protein